MTHLESITKKESNDIDSISNVLGNVCLAEKSDTIQSVDQNNDKETTNLLCVTNTFRKLDIVDKSDSECNPSSELKSTKATKNSSSLSSIQVKKYDGLCVFYLI